MAIILVFLHLTDFTYVIISSCICVAANGVILFFFMVEYPLCIVTMCFLASHLLMDM